MFDSDENLAPVIPLFGAATATTATAVEVEVDADEVRENAENSLLRKLRTRALSLSEARAVLVDADADPQQIEEIIEDCVRRGYLNDYALAENLAQSFSQRKGMGRAAIARTLSQRGIERQVIDEVFDAVPNEDEKLALEFARKKAASMRHLEREVAVRRLAGQLARRGFTASAVRVASQAFDEAQRPTGGVRFR